MIDKIEAGGSSSGFNLIENVTVNEKELTSSGIYFYVWVEEYKDVTFKFTPKKDVYFLVSSGSYTQINPSPEGYADASKVKQGTEYTMVGSKQPFSCAFLEERPYGNGQVYQDLDFFSLLYV